MRRPPVRGIAAAVLVAATLTTGGGAAESPAPSFRLVLTPLRDSHGFTGVHVEETFPDGPAGRIAVDLPSAWAGADHLADNLVGLRAGSPSTQVTAVDPNGRFDASGPPNAAIVETAGECGASFRARKLELAFPDGETRDDLRLFLWSSLVLSAGNRWGSMERTPGTAALSPRAKLAATLRDVGGIGLPVAVAAAVWLVPGWLHLSIDGDLEVLRRNLALTLTSWSALSVLAAINPRRFETQLSASKTLGDLIKGG